MIISKIKKGCRVGFFGLGKSTSSLLRYLPLDKCEITLRDKRIIERDEIPKGLPIKRVLCGEKRYREINEDVIFFSPSVKRDAPELITAKQAGVVFSSDAELFFESNHTPVIAITGSDGKSTTATLTHLLLTASGYSSYLVGNIGTPFTQNSDNVCDFFVTELSSFMLSYLTPRSVSACITNITPNHLDWHRDPEEYRAAKLNIAKNTDRLIVSDGEGYVKGATGIISVERSLGELKRLYEAELYITLENDKILKNGTELLTLSQIKRKEAHNLKNLMMAIALTDGIVAKREIQVVARTFTGLAHRCECFLTRNGVEYIDSSIDSTPARTAATLCSLNRDAVVILGGRGKGLDYDELIPSLKRYARAVIVSGENKYEIASRIKDDVRIEIIDDFTEAVLRGILLAGTVGALVLSPASTSYDKFRNYAERGEKFKQIILENT